MSYGITKTLKRRLDKLNISDFHGLISPGFTCYLNSVLQVLFMTEEFRDRIKRCSEDERTLDKHLKNLFLTLERERARTHDITQILSIDDVFEQRDAAEYFEKILRSTSPKASELFKGELNHTTKCYKCKKRSEAPGFFWILPLSIKDPHQTYRVEKGLEEFFSKEEVYGENKIYCAQCDKKQVADIICEMSQPPDILTLLLKRFHYDYELKRNVKLNCEAEVPLILQIKGFTYDLYAMIKHYGYLSGGHYIAHIYSVQTKEWYCFDDERVKLKRNYLASENSFLRSHSAYLLMYMKRRRDPENAFKNEVINADDEVKETQMETRWKREGDAEEDYTMFDEMKETGKATNRSLKSQGKLNGLLNSGDSTRQFQETSSNKHKAKVSKTGTSERHKSVHTSDSKYSPKSNTRSKSVTSSKQKVWK